MKSLTDRLGLFERTLLIRRFEEGVIRISAEILGPWHVYIGQEATAVGTMAVVEPGDHLSTTHRNHGHLLAAGADPGALMAEIFGKATGTNRGRGGSMHAVAPSLGFMATSAMVAASIPVVTGAGYAAKMRGQDRVALALFGDGAMNEGAAYEALNLAALWQLPVVYLCENNGPGGDGSNVNGTLGTSEIRRIPGAFNMNVVSVDGADVDQVQRTVRQAVARARSGGGPTFIEARTVPWPGSLYPAEAWAGRTELSSIWNGVRRGDLEAWHAAHDPVIRFGRLLLARGEAAQADLERIDREVGDHVEQAILFARQSPYPAPEEALRDVYGPSAVAT